ncbi:MAG TPA: hypothetical protein VI758_07760, partial [Bacteroidota bacterium]
RLAQGVYANWADGWTAGGGLSFSISNRSDLLFEGRLSYLPYEGNNLELAFPAIAGLRWSVTGQPTRIYETAVGVRFRTPGTFVKPFLAVRAGLVVTEIGRIIISEWFEGQPDNISRGLYGNSGKTVARAAGSVGIGGIIPITAGFAFITEARFEIVFATEQVFLPIALSAQLEL